MEVNTLYLTTHTYSRIVERTALQLKWGERKYPFRYYKDFLFFFLDELFKVDCLKEIGRNHYVTNISIFEANLVVPVRKIDYSSIYIPTVLFEKVYLNNAQNYNKGENLEWLYPVKIIPKRPPVPSFFSSGRLSIKLSFTSLISALYEYSYKTNKIVLGENIQEFLTA